jgi:hypothetical protein
MTRLAKTLVFRAIYLRLTALALGVLTRNRSIDGQVHIVWSNKTSGLYEIHLYRLDV